jgi:hypothetical protein
MRACFILLLLFSALQSHTQSLLIVKDYNNCTVGLQDGSGRWITQPVYEQIEPFSNGFARVLLNGKWGLLNEAGKEAVAPKYAALSFLCDNTSFAQRTTPEFVKVSDNSLAGVVDTSGKVILPCAYREIACRIDSVFLVRKEVYWSFVHRNGEVYQTNTTEQPVSVGRHVFRITKTETVPDPKNPGMEFIRRHEGVITDKAEVVIPVIYDHIDPAEARARFKGYEVSLNGKTGYYDSRFRKILDPEYTVWREQEYRNHPVRSFMFLYGYTAAEKDNRIGVIALTGDTILPFIFDSICIPQNKTTDAGSIPFWEVRLNGKWGVIDSAGKWLVQPVMEHVQVNAASHYAVPVNRLLEFSVCIARTNGKYGALNLKGDTLLRFQYDSCWNNFYSPVFWSPEECIVLTLYNQEADIGITHSTLKGWYRSDKKINQRVRPGGRSEIYRDHRGDTVIFYNKEAWKNDFPSGHKERLALAQSMPYPYLLALDGEPYFTVEHIERKRSLAPGYSTYVYADRNYYPYDDNTVEAIYDSATGRVWHGRYQIRMSEERDEITFGAPETGTGIISVKGDLIIPPNTYQEARRAESPSGLVVYFVRTFSGKAGLVDPTGAMVMDTLWNIIIAGNDTVWANRKISSTSSGCEDQWSAYDIRSRQIVNDSSLHLLLPLSSWEGRNVVHTPAGTGLMEAPSMRVIIPPVFTILYPLDDSLQFYAVSTCSGRLGVYDPHGKLIVDTIYSEIYLTEYRTANGYSKGPVLRTYVLSNSADDFALLHVPSGTVSRDTTAYREVIAALASYKPFESGSYLFSKVKLPSLLITDGVNTLTAWQYKLLFAQLVTSGGFQLSLRSYIAGARNSCSCGYMAGRKDPYIRDGVQPHLQVVFTTDSVMSVQSKVNYSRFSEDAAGWYEFQYNYMNFAMTPAGALRMELPDLFADTAWRAIVTDSVMSFLRAHPGINADCSRPHLYPSILRRDFLMMRDGLRLFPRWEENTNGDKLPQRPVIFIPWTVLRPHLTPAMEHNLFP